MKRTALFLLFILGVIISLISEASSADKSERTLPFKSAIIHYEIKGENQNGTEDLYIQGIKSCRVKHVTTRVGERSEKEDLMVIDDGINLYSIDLNQKIGTKMLSPQKMFEEMTPEERKILEETGQAIIKGITGAIEPKPIGTEEILGKPCKIYEISKMKIWQWEGIPLKTEMHLLGKITQIATSIKVNVSISASRFRPPAGIKIQDITEEQKNLVKNNFFKNLTEEQK